MVDKLFKFFEEVIEIARDTLKEEGDCGFEKCSCCGCKCPVKCPCCGHPECGHNHDNAEPKCEKESECCGEPKLMSVPLNEVKAQGIFDAFRFTDKEVVDKVIEVIKAIDVGKVQALMKLIDIKDNTLHLEFEFKLKNKE